jgi:nitrite reductase/ring-hydroxylating ferredoxin subunit
MEWIRIFSSKTEAIAKLKEAKPQLVLIGSIRVCLVLLDGKLHAIDDKCSHNGESLSKGTVNYLAEIVCPWHSYRFKLNSGREAGERSNDVKTYALKEDENGVYILI